MYICNIIKKKYNKMIDEVKKIIIEEVTPEFKMNLCMLSYEDEIMKELKNNLEAIPDTLWIDKYGCEIIAEGNKMVQAGYECYISLYGYTKDEMNIKDYLEENGYTALTEYVEDY